MKSMDKYQKLAARTMNPALTKKETVEHAKSNILLHYRYIQLKSWKEIGGCHELP